MADTSPTSRRVVPDGPRRSRDDPALARRAGVRDAERGAAATSATSPARRRTAMLIAEARAASCTALLPRCPDPGMALTNLERFVAASPRPEAMLRRPGRTAPGRPRSLVQLFSTSQHFSELMIRDPSLLDWLRAGAERRDRDALIDDLWDELDEARRRGRPSGWRSAGSASARCSGSATTTSSASLPLEVITLDLSHLADACVEAACRLARAPRRGSATASPAGRDGQPGAVRRPRPGQARRRRS